MMSMAPVVENILKDNVTSQHARILGIQKRYDDFVKRGIIQEEPPKTFGASASVIPNDLKNKHIDYTLSKKPLL